MSAVLTNNDITISRPVGFGPTEVSKYWKWPMKSCHNCRMQPLGTHVVKTQTKDRPLLAAVILQGKWHKEPTEVCLESPKMRKILTGLTFWAILGHIAGGYANTKRGFAWPVWESWPNFVWLLRGNLEGALKISSVAQAVPVTGWWHHCTGQRKLVGKNSSYIFF